MSRARHVRAVLAGLLLVVPLLAVGPGASARHAPAARALGMPCVHWSQEAVYRVYGYDHLVHLRSQCQQTAACEVRTNVNPDAVRTTLSPGESRTVLTFKSSPARVFRAHVRCAAAD